MSTEMPLFSEVQKIDKKFFIIVSIWMRWYASEAYFITVHYTYSPTTRKTRYNLRNHAKLKLKLNTFGRRTENLSDLSSKGIAFHMRVPEKE